MNATETCEGKQLIHLAVEHDHVDVLLFLVDNGAHIDPEPDWDALLEQLSLCSGSSASPTMQIHTQKVKVTTSNVCKMAAGQGAKEVLNTILVRHRHQLGEMDIREALIGGATAGHVTIVEFLHGHVSRDHAADTLSRALACAVAHGHLDVVEYLMRQDVYYKDFSLLSRAGRLMRQLLRHASPAEIEADEQLQIYNRILLTLAERQRWWSIIQPTIRRSQLPPLSEEEAEYLVPFHVRSIPEEMWWVILNVLAHNHLSGP